MTEPNTTAAVAVPLISLAIELLGPGYGQYAVIAAGAISGSMWALVNTVTSTRWSSFWLACRSILTAIILTSFASGLIGPMVGMDAPTIYVVVAFGIAALGDKWLDIIESIKARIQSAVLNSKGAEK